MALPEGGVASCGRHGAPRPSGWTRALLAPSFPAAGGVITGQCRILGASEEDEVGDCRPAETFKFRRVR